MNLDDLLDQFRVEPGKKSLLKDRDPVWTGAGELKELEDAQGRLAAVRRTLLVYG